MKKICHITSNHTKDDVRIFHKECTSLARENYKVYLVQEGESDEKNGVQIIGCGRSSSNGFKRITQGSKNAYKKALKVDAELYHLHDPELLPYALRLKRKGKKVIFDSHENNYGFMREKPYIPAFIRPIIALIYREYEKYICKRIDGVITVTPDLTEYFKRINSNVAEVTNYPVFEEDIPQPAFDGARVVFAGGVKPEWNHHHIINALEGIENFTYVLCGPSDEQYVEQLKGLPNWNKVKYLGKIPHQEVKNQLQKSTIGVALWSPCNNTYWNRGTLGCNKIFEEMMAGLPVICTDFQLWRDFVERCHCGLCVNPENENEIREALIYLISNPDEARQMGENGREAVRSEYNWQKEKDILVAFYRKLL